MVARVAAASSGGEQKLEVGQARPHPRRQLTGAYAVAWLPLNKAAVTVAHDVERARERLERAISKAWRTPEGHVPQPLTDPNVPLRIQVTPPRGLRIEGRAWLDGPVLHWDASEIECPCKPWPPRLAQSSAPATQCRVKIEVWGDDLMRLWSRGNLA